MTDAGDALRVTAKDVAADGVVVLTLAHPGGARLADWTPGAHIDLHLPDGTTRQYSLCGDRFDAHTYRVGVLREPAGRGGSAYVHDVLAVGDVVGVGGPRNNFPLVPSERYLFVAGGIGITPILPMIAACEAAGKPWRLVYGGRRASSMAFRDELDRHGDRVSYRPQDTHGLLDLDAVLGEPTPDTAVYCCGPGALLDAVELRCASWPAGSLHVERFRPKDGALDGVNSGFEVELELSGLTFTVTADQTLAEAIEAAGVDLPTSCREGTCGTCETTVLAGEPDHRDSYLTPEEQESNEVMMPCCSRARSPRLVLDL